MIKWFFASVHFSEEYEHSKYVKIEGERRELDGFQKKGTQ